VQKFVLLCLVVFLSFSLPIAARPLPDLTAQQKALLQQVLERIEAADEGVAENLRNAVLDTAGLDVGMLQAAIASLDDLISAIEQALPLAAQVIDTSRVEAFLENRKKVRASALKALDLIAAEAARKAALTKKSALIRNVKGEKTYVKALKPYFGNVESAGDVLILEELKTRSTGFRIGGETVCFRLHGYVGNDGSTLGNIEPVVSPEPDGPDSVVAAVTPMTSHGEFCVVLGKASGPVEVTVTHEGKTTRRSLFSRGTRSSDDTHPLGAGSADRRYRSSVTEDNEGNEDGVWNLR